MLIEHLLFGSTCPRYRLPPCPWGACGCHNTGAVLHLWWHLCSFFWRELLYSWLIFSPSCQFCLFVIQFSSVQSLLIGVRLFATPWTAAHQASLSITDSRSLLKLMCIMVVMPSNHLILCRPLLLLPSVCPSFLGFLTFCFQVSMNDLEPQWFREKLPASPPCTHLSHLGAPWWCSASPCLLPLFVCLWKCVCFLSYFAFSSNLKCVSNLGLSEALLLFSRLVVFDSLWPNELLTHAEWYIDIFFFLYYW